MMLVQKMTKFLLLACVLVFASGCAAQVKYGFDKDLFVSSSPKKFSVVVDIFQDKRPDREITGELPGKQGYATTKDKAFKKDIPLQVSQMLVEHLTKAKVFEKVKQQDIDNDIENKADAQQALKSQGYDLAVVGSLDHFYGYYSDELSAAMSGMFGALGVLTEAIVNPKTVGGKVEYGEVKIVSLVDGKVIWQGNVGNEFENEEKFYDSPVGYVLKALKTTNDKFSRDLSGSSF